jgi:pimeloyl-ACP methyl ester carboxylesterase
MSKVVFPLHGIRTLAEWQKAFADLAAKHSWICPLDRWHYGIFSIFNFVNPRDRFAKVTWFRSRYTEALNEYQTIIDGDEDRPSVVAHSFGTYILGYSLLRYNNIKFDKVILCGSILPTNFPWDELIESGQVHAVRNDIGVEDFWSKVCGFVVPGTGPSGKQGFSKKHPRLIQTEHNLTHSEFFESSWMKENWIPFLEFPFDAPVKGLAGAGDASATADKSTPGLVHGLASEFKGQRGRIKIPSGDYPAIVFFVWSILLGVLIAAAALGVSRFKLFFASQQVELRFAFDSVPPDTVPALVQYSGYFNSKGSLLDLNIEAGRATFDLPWSVTNIDSIKLTDKSYMLGSEGPFPLNGEPITINVASSLVSPESSLGMPDLVTLDGIPTRKEVERIRRSKLPSEVKLFYRNGTSKNIALFVLDLSSYFQNGRQDWQVWPCPKDFDVFGGFQEPSQGAFFFVARDLSSGHDHSLGWFSLFEHEENYLEIVMQDNKVVGILSPEKP